MKLTHEELSLLIDSLCDWLDALSLRSGLTEAEIYRKAHLLLLLRSASKKLIDLEADNRPLSYVFSWKLSNIEKFTILRCYGAFGGQNNIAFRAFIGRLDKEIPGVNSHLIKSFEV